MSEDYIIRNCAPTLAGLKTGSIFVCPYESGEALRDAVRDMNRRLGPKGLRVLPLRLTKTGALIYIYRPRKLAADLSHSTAETILRRHGYPTESSGQCIVQLIRRLKEQDEFPHEIGLFLGYPPEDVDGFIENKACDCKCTGCWKVYGDQSAAEKKFAQYKKCTRIYLDQWSKGKAIERLAVVK